MRSVHLIHICLDPIIYDWLVVRSPCINSKLAASHWFARTQLAPSSDPIWIIVVAVRLKQPLQLSSFASYYHF